MEAQDDYFVNLFSPLFKILSATKASELQVAPTATELPDDPPEDYQLIIDFILEVEVLSACEMLEWGWL